MAERSVVEKQIVEAAWKDQAFRKQLLTDPRSALKRFNIVVPDSVNLKIHEEDGSTVHFIIPADPASSKLSDAELDAVAGGGTCDDWTSPFC